MAIIKVLSKELAFLGAFYVCVRYLGDFPSRQSAVLTFLAWICYELYSKLSSSRRVESVFEPFSVSIYPNWYELLSDFKLIGGMEEWHRLREETEKLPPSEYSVFQSGFHFTVIRPPSDGLLPGLTFWDNRRIFLSDVEFSESIVKIKDEFVVPRLEKAARVFQASGVGSIARNLLQVGKRRIRIGVGSTTRMVGEPLQVGRDEGIGQNKDSQGPPLRYNPARNRHASLLRVWYLLRCLNGSHERMGESEGQATGSKRMETERQRRL